MLFGLALGFGSAAAAQQVAPPTLPPTGMLKSGGLFLVNGDRAVFAIGADGRATLVGAGRAPSPADQKTPNDGLASAQVSFALSRGSEGNTLLVVNSRAATPLRYQARIVGVRDGKVLSAATSTCPVRPGASSLENWPQTVPAVVIVSIEQAQPDDTVCR
jgi:hypothetical protein